MSQLFEELKRRNVFRVGLAYVAVAWLVLQVSDIVLDNIAAPAWLMQALMFFLAIGFPIAILFAWAYEMTPEGIKREKDVDRSASITSKTGQKLNRTIIAVLAAAVAFLLVDKFLLVNPAPTTDASDKSVAVLPFVAMSRGEDDEYFADGLTEEILNSLTRVPELLVTARTSAFHFKGQDIPIPEIAETLGVANIVEGSVRRDGDRLRVTAQLIRAADGFHLWSKNYDRETADTFGVQTNIAEEISAALGIVLDEEQLAQMRDAGVRDPAAFVALQKGYELYEAAHASTDLTDQLRAANTWFDRALAIEPGISDAYFSHADYYTHLLLDSQDDPDADPEALDAAYRGLVAGLDNSIRTAGDEARRLASSLDLAIVSGSWRSTPDLLTRLVETGSCVGSGWADAVSVAYGKAEEIRVLASRLAECDPLAFHGWRWQSLAQTWVGDTEAAVQTGQRGLEVLQHTRIAQELFRAYLAAGQIESAEQLINRHMRDEQQIISLRETLAAARGDKALSEELTARLQEMGAQRPIGYIASFARRGDRDGANQRAAELDARPYGYLRLMLVPPACMCGAPWDLDATPNFAELLNDADLPWPPASPIDWPLKNW